VASNVDVLIVFYNSSNFIGPLLHSLRAVSIPITAYFLDNASRDGTADKLAREIPNLPFRAFLFRARKNHGFARGINLLSRQSNGDFIFMLNPDAELETGCLERLVAKAESDPTVGILEARQSPREHQKAVMSMLEEELTRSNHPSRKQSLRDAPSRVRAMNVSPGLPEQGQRSSFC